VFFGAFAIWQGLAWGHVFPSFALPSPSEVGNAFGTLTSKGYLNSTLQQDLWTSLVRVLTAFVGAVVLGVAVGILIAEFKVLYTIIDPFLQFIRPIPPLAYIPLFVVWFGIGEQPKVLLILVAALPVMVINTYNGVRRTPIARIEVARNLGASRFQILRLVTFPSSLPDIFTGMKVSIGVAWSTLVAAELIAADRGLGWLIEQAGTQLQTPMVIVGILIIGLVGYLMDLGIRLLERVVVPWKQYA